MFFMSKLNGKLDYILNRRSICETYIQKSYFFKEMAIRFILSLISNISLRLYFLES